MNVPTQEISLLANTEWQAIKMESFLVGLGFATAKRRIHFPGETEPDPRHLVVAIPSDEVDDVDMNERLNRVGFTRH